MTDEEVSDETILIYEIVDAIEKLETRLTEAHEKQQKSPRNNAAFDGHWLILAREAKGLLRVLLAQRGGTIEEDVTVWNHRYGAIVVSSNRDLRKENVQLKHENDTLRSAIRIVGDATNPR